MRTFVALEVPEHLKRSVSRQVAVLRPTLPAARWVRAESYHLTLVFLGEVDDEAASELRGTLRRVFGHHPTFIARLGSAGAFPPRRPARVLWVGFDAPDELRRLQHDVVGACAEITCRRESRPFHAHVTVARCRRPWSRAAVERWRDGFPESIGDPFTVNRGVLMRSRLQPDGARYETLEAFELAR